MEFRFTEEQQELRSSARSFLQEYSSSARVRQAMETELGYDVDVWRRISGELGWTGVIVPEEYGGLGLGHVELVALLEEMGRTLLCAPFFSTVCLAGNALTIGASEAQRKEHLPGIAQGQTTAALAYMEPNGRYDATGIEAVARRQGDELVLNGTKSFVLDGHSAQLIVVAARIEDSSGEGGISLFIVPADTPGLERRLLPTMDQTRKQAELVMHDLRLPVSALMGEWGAGWTILSQTLDLAAVALSAEQLGGAQRCLDMSVQHAKERMQFGRAIGSFQAIKHKCADMMVRVESARSASYYAGWAATEGDPELPVLASMAQAYGSDTYFQCAAESLQIHGGVGFTWEYDVHLHLKRARSTEILLGDATYHRERVAQLIGL